MYVLSAPIPRHSSRSGQKITKNSSSKGSEHPAHCLLQGYGFEAYNFSGGFRFYDAVMNDRTLIEVAFACGMDK